MTRSRATRWLVSLSISVGVVVASLALVWLIQLAFGISLPGSVVVTIGFLAGTLSSQIKTRSKTLEDMDPYSTQTRTRNTVRLIEDWRRQQR